MGTGYRSLDLYGPRTASVAVFGLSRKSVRLDKPPIANMLAVVALGAMLATAVACTPTAPTPPPPPASPAPPPRVPPLTMPDTSSLKYNVPAAATHTASSGDYTTANATFAASVRTTCVPNPNIFGSVCPDLRVRVRPNGEPLCQLFAFAPLGETLSVRAYPTAQRSPGVGIAGLGLNCAKGGTSCGELVGQFTVRELEANADGTVTRLHMTLEQTCVGGSGTSGFGKLLGELWIIGGTTPF